MSSQTRYAGEIGLDGARNFKPHWNAQIAVLDHVLEFFKDKSVGVGRPVDADFRRLHGDDEAGRRHSRHCLNHEVKITDDRSSVIEWQIGLINGESYLALGAVLRTLGLETSQHWAAIQHDLGNAYQDRIRGTRADNWSRRSPHTPRRSRSERARPAHATADQADLGDAYWARIRGERANNMEQAIAACAAALTVWMREASPQEWAWTQTNLGIAYWQRILGGQAENLERAIAALEATLTVRTREAGPREWERTQSPLGIAYWQRMHGDGAENLEKAIAALEAVLGLSTRVIAAKSISSTGTLCRLSQ